MGILSFLSAPSLRVGDLLSLRSHSRQHASVLPNIREWLLPPGGFRWPRERFLKVVSYWPRRAIRDNVCAATRMAQSERSRPSRTDLTARASTCFQAFRSNRRFMVSTSSPMSCGLRRNAFAPALRATASESVPDIITIGIYCR